MPERITKCSDISPPLSLAEVPLYYTGLSDIATITFEGDKSTSKLVKLDRIFNVYLNICEFFLAILRFDKQDIATKQQHKIGSTYCFGDLFYFRSAARLRHNVVPGRRVIRGMRGIPRGKTIMEADRFDDNDI